MHVFFIYSMYVTVCRLAENRLKMVHLEMHNNASAVCAGHDDMCFVNAFCTMTVLYVKFSSLVMT